MAEPARTIAITGATGEIGSHLARKAAQKGDTVHLGGRNFAKLEERAHELSAENEGVEYRA